MACWGTVLLITLLDLVAFLTREVDEGLLYLLVFGSPFLALPAAFWQLKATRRTCQGRLDAALARLTCGASLVFLGSACVMLGPGAGWMHALAYLTCLRLMPAALVNLMVATPLAVLSPERKAAALSGLAAGAGLWLIFGRSAATEVSPLVGVAGAVVAASFAYGLVWGGILQSLLQKSFSRPQ